MLLKFGLVLSYSILMYLIHKDYLVYRLYVSNSLIYHQSYSNLKDYIEDNKSVMY